MKKLSRDCEFCNWFGTGTDKGMFPQYHDKTCDCICHIGDGPQVSTQWNISERDLISLLDDQRQDGV